MFEELEDDIKVIDSISNGSFSEVYSAKSIELDEMVAIKKFRKVSHYLKELNVLENMSGKHENIIRMIKYFDECCSIMFELCRMTLLDLLEDEKLDEQRIRNMMRQLLRGLAFIHENGIVHMDIKPENLLISGTNTLKICDFDSAIKASTSDIDSNHPQMVTLWYRPIEVLLGSSLYTFSIDIWSAGCVMAEMYRNEPLFKGLSEIDMLNKIIDVLGTPTKDCWPEIEEMPVMRSIELRKQSENRIKDHLNGISECGADLISKMLCFDPKRRIVAEQALNHSFFDCL